MSNGATTLTSDSVSAAPLRPRRLEQGLTARGATGKLNVLVNNAGIISYGALKTFDLQVGATGVGAQQHSSQLGSSAAEFVVDSVLVEDVSHKSQ
jgi:hypothetical protein